MVKLFYSRLTGTGRVKLLEEWKNGRMETCLNEFIRAGMDGWIAKLLNGYFPQSY